MRNKRSTIMSIKKLVHNKLKDSPKDYTYELLLTLFFLVSLTIAFLLVICCLHLF